jgi:hypothetical protein
MLIVPCSTTGCAGHQLTVSNVLRSLCSASNLPQAFQKVLSKPA